MKQDSRGSLAKARRRQKVASLYLQGWSQSAIGEHLQISAATIGRDLQRIRVEWRDSTIRDFDMLQSIELRKLDQLEREAWAAWERSQKPSHQARIKGGGTEHNAERLIKNQTGDPRFLEHIQKCVAARRALLGLDAPTRVEAVGTFVGPLTSEQRMVHIAAIVAEFQQSKLAQEQIDESRTIDAAFSHAIGRGSAAIEPGGAQMQDGA